MSSEATGHYELLDGLAEEFAARRRRGERPTLDEYIARHPALAEEIRELFPALVEIERGDEDRRVATAPPGPPPGTGRFGDFLILREVGRGGMGVVYEAIQLSLGRHVALKVLLHGDRADAMRIERFRLEARAAARLHHTNIVPVFGVGDHEGMPYYAMQFIAGVGMDQVLTELKRLRARDGAGDRTIAEEGTREAGDALAPSRVARSLLTGRPEPSGRDDGEATTAPAVAPVTTLGGQAEESTAIGTAPGASRSASPTPPPVAPASLLGPGPGEDPASPGSRRPTYWQRVARIGADVADALAYAHAQGVLHRDIKPSNLLFDARGAVWVTDFGLAKLDDQLGPTQTGDILGTLRYMPPEALEGHHDARSDVYSLGLSLYELLAFRPAFDQLDRGRLIRRVTTDEPPRLHALNPDVPRDLETVIHKAIERVAAHRYQAASELAEDLRRFVDDRPVRARQASGAEKAIRWCRRNPAIATLAAVLVAVLIATTAASLAVARQFHRQALAQRGLAIEKEIERRGAEAARHNADAEAYRASVKEARALRLGRPPGWRGQSLAILSRLAGRDVPGRDPVELRSEAVACLGDIDIEEVARFQGGRGAVRTLTFSPDGATLATLTVEGTLQAWDVRAGRALRSVDTSRQPIFSPAPRFPYHPGAGPLAFLTDAGEIRWLGPAPPPRVGHAGTVWALDTDRDGRRMAVVGADGHARVYELPAGKLLLEQACRGNVMALAPDGSRLATIGPGGGIRLTEVAGAHATSRLDRVNAPCTKLSFSPDGTLLAYGDEEGAVRVWDLAASRQRMALRGHESFVLGLSFSPDGRLLATCGYDMTARVWETRTGRLVVTMQPGSRLLQDVAFSPDGEHLAVATEDGYSVLYAVRGRSERGRFEGVHLRVRGVAFDPSRPRLYSVGAYGAAVAWDLASGRVAWRSPNDAGDPWHLAVSPDGAWLITGQMGRGPLRLFRTEGGMPPRPLAGHQQSVEAVAFDPESRHVASGGSDGVVIHWRIHDRQAEWRVQAVPDWIEAIGFLAGGDEILIGSHSRGLVILDARTGKELRAAAVPGGVDQFAISTGGDRVWVCTYENRVRSFRLPGLEETASAPGAFDGDQVRAMAVSPDGTLLVTADAQGSIAIYDPGSLRLLFTMPTSTRWIEQVAFDPSSNLLAFVGNDFDVSTWDLGLIRAELEALGLGLGPGPPSPTGARPVGEGLLPAMPRAIGPPIGDAADLDRAGRALADRLVKATARLEAGDRAGYRRACAEALEQFGARTETVLQGDLARMCVLADGATDDPLIAVRLAEAAVAEATPERVGDALVTLGAALCRAGRIAEAIRALEAGIERLGGRGRPWDRAFLAIAHARLGHRDEARRWLSPDSGPEEAPLTARQVELLRREVEATILDDGFPADPFAT